MENQYLAVAKLNSSEIDDLIVCSIGPFLLCYLNVAATISHAVIYTAPISTIHNHRQ